MSKEYYPPKPPVNPLSQIKATVDSVSISVNFSVKTDSLLKYEADSGINNFINDTIPVVDNSSSLSGQLNVTFVIVKFNNPISTDTALLYLKYLGLQAATLTQMRFYLSQNQR